MGPDYNIIMYILMLFVEEHVITDYCFDVWCKHIQSRMLITLENVCICNQTDVRVEIYCRDFIVLSEVSSTNFIPFCMLLKIQ